MNAGVIELRNKLERDAIRNQIAQEIISSKEALEILGFSRMRLSQLVKEGEIIPIRSGIYLKDDIIAYAESRK